MAPQCRVIEASDDVKLDKDESFVVMIRTCEISSAVDTKLFGDLEIAKAYCKVTFDIPPDKWNAYLVAPDESSKMKLNGEPVAFVGWHYELDDSTIHLHLERKVVEF